jgi:lipoprotein-anchoring transpeptidase ErfK/SrfK
MKGIDGTYTDPGPPPEGLAPGEKWIDVNLSRQTLVMFQGDQPIYATMVSTGKKAKDPTDKAHDHQTVQGSFRIREKHISTTMDGDGPAPGDMPYSIEDVPYVMYFEGSYALHGAFWHNNFGREQSHGCVNLAPLDAKQIFFLTEPQLPQGWHGIIATKDKPGTRVVVHE